MKRSLFFVWIVGFCVFFLSSCLDYVQTITYKDGKYHNYFKITVSKLLMEIAGEDSDSFVEEVCSNFQNGFPEYVSLRGVNTEIDAGVEISFALSPKTATEEEKLFLPKISGNKYFIPFILAKELEGFAGADSLDSNSDEMTLAFLSSAKIRIMVAKNIIPAIEVAYFEGTGGKNFAIPVFDYKNSFCLEIPFIVLFEKSLYNFDRIVVIKPS